MAFLIKALKGVLLTAATLLIAVGCKSRSDSSTTVVRNQMYTVTPLRPSVAPASFKVFHKSDTTYTLVVPGDATDEQVESLIWELRDAAHARTLDKLKLSQKMVDERKPLVWFHIYRGSRCASEKYADGPPPCGGSYHAAGDYTYGGYKNRETDNGSIFHGDDHETQLWDPEVPYAKGIKSKRRFPSGMTKGGLVGCNAMSRVSERDYAAYVVALVSDKPGVLTRVASLFRRLNINIVSLTVGESERADVSRMTIVCEAPEHAAHRIKASLYKLEITVDVDEVGRSEAVIRELCLIKVEAGPSHPLGQNSRSQIFELANVFRARVVDLAPESIMLEMTGAASKIEGLIQVITESGYNILEVSRTGRMAMRRGHHTSRVLKALGTPNDAGSALSEQVKLSPEEILPNEFEDVHEEEE